MELAPVGIRAKALCSGMVGTTMRFDHLMANQPQGAFKERMGELTPLGLPQTDADMGQAAVYLATAPNASGIALNAAGGFEMH